MLIISNIAALLTAPSLTISAFVMVQDKQELARIAYSNCLIDAHNEAIDASMTSKQFDAKTKKICIEERKVYFDLVYNDEQQFGSSAKEAEEYANEESDNIRKYITSSFVVNRESKAHLVKP